MPLSMTSNLTHGAPSRVSRARRERHGAVLCEFRGIAEQIDNALLELGEVGLQRADVLRAVDHERVAVLFHHRFDDGLHLVDQSREKDVLQINIHAAGFDLG